MSESDFCPEQAAKVTMLSVAIESARIFSDFSPLIFKISETGMRGY